MYEKGKLLKVNRLVLHRIVNVEAKPCLKLTEHIRKPSYFLL